MKEKVNLFISNTNGQFLEVSSKDALYQCMDLAYVWAFVLGFPKATIQHQFAYQVFANASDLTRQYFDIITNTPEAIPQDGDLVVWGDKYGPAGHIAVALGGGSLTSFKCFEQNNPIGTNAHIQSRGYDNVLGWLRPKITPISEVITDQKTKLDFGGLQAFPGAETYHVLEMGTVGAKLIAKDGRINELESLPPPPVFTKPIAKLHYELAKEFEAATA